MSAVFGVDACVVETTLNHGVVCVDKTYEKEREVFNTFRSIRAEDVVFIKSFTPQSGLQIKAAGVALSDYPAEHDAEVCIPVKWVWRGKKLIDEFDETCSQRGDLLYEEHNITVQKEIIDLISSKLHLPNEW